jgi:hypothetical protein
MSSPARAAWLRVGSVVGGCVAALTLNAVGMFVTVFAADELFDGRLSIGRLGALTGITQLAYLGPIWFIERRRGSNAFAAGIMLGAAVTLLIAGDCWISPGHW